MPKSSNEIWWVYLVFLVQTPLSPSTVMSRACKVELLVPRSNDPWRSVAASPRFDNYLLAEANISV